MSRVFSAIWRTLNISRQIFFNVIFLLLLVLIIAALAGGETPDVPDGGALVVAPTGQLVEQLSADPVQQALNDATGQGEPQTLLRELVAAIDGAAKDQRIKALVIRLDRFAGGSLPVLREVALALERFKESGKPVIALGDSFGQSQYYLAAHADEILMHPMGSVLIRGLGFNQLYYKELSNKLGVDWNVVRVGEFKSAVEPMIRNDMSAEARENYRNLLGDLWLQYQQEVTGARGLPENKLADYVENLVPALRDSGGDAGRLAVEAGLVDRLATHQQMRDRIIEITGEDEENGGFRGIDAEIYAQLTKPQRMLARATQANKIAVIVASGAIIDGRGQPGTIGGEELAARIDAAADAEEVKGIVLRVDSPGGSAFASDVILDAVRAAQDKGKPVVVSMSGVAASGGYWISMGADQIWAYPSTITGSIGVFGQFPTFEKSLEKIGVHSDSVATTWLANEFSIIKDLSPRATQLTEIAVQNIYQQFVGQVAEFRDMSFEAVDAIAGGRVWSGRDALEHGLVDSLGTLDQAIAATAELAGVEKYAVDYRERKLSLQEKILINMLSARMPLVSDVVAGMLPRSPYLELLSRTGQAAELRTLVRTLSDSRAVAYCFCKVEW